jgi:hypothetical protein
MDTYVFMLSPDGTELVNPAQPGLEGRNLMEVKDLTGKATVREEIAAALRDGRAWIDTVLVQAGHEHAGAQAGVRPPRSIRYETYVVGSGLCVD